MSELQLYLLAGGAVFIVAVVIYNLVQERGARQRAERAFGERAPDALLGEDDGERREPTLGALPVSAGEEPELATDGPRPANAAEELDAAGTVATHVSSRIDTVAVILADDPVMAEQLEPLERALQGHTTPVHIEGIVDEQWHPVEASPRQSWRELRVGLQLASRKGALLEDEIEAFNRAIAEFAGEANAVSQREAPATAAARARELDAFCADADIEVAVNVVGQSGVTFSIARVKQLALEQGLAQNVSGELVRYGDDGTPEFAIRRLDDPNAKPSGVYYTGLTFAMDVPHVAEGPRVLAEMIALAEAFAATLGGQLVDDNRRALSEAGIASIRRSLERVFHEMEEHGIPAGSPLARRLFS